MPAPSAPLYIDAPGVGTARVWFRIVGDQYESFTANVYEELDWKGAGEIVFSDIDESKEASIIGPMWQTPIALIREILTLSAVPQSSLDDRAMIDWFLSRPKAEADVWLLKWAKDKIFPVVGTWASKVLGGRLGSTSTQSGGYYNVEEALNSIWSKARVSITNGQIVVTIG